MNAKYRTMWRYVILPKGKQNNFRKAITYYSSLLIFQNCICPLDIFRKHSTSLQMHLFNNSTTWFFNDTQRWRSANVLSIPQTKVISLCLCCFFVHALSIYLNELCFFVPLEISILLNKTIYCPKCYYCW